MARFKPLFEDEGQLELNPSLLYKDWSQLESKAGSCRACPLAQTRTQTVTSRGDKDGQLLIVGEAPGEKEDSLGRAFVGDSGRLLDIMLDSVGLDSCLVTNTVRCRPPQNRNPTKAECRTCFSYLQSEIALVDPQAILCLGKTSASTLLGRVAKFERLMNRQHHYYQYPVWVAYHPAYLLREPSLSKHSPKWQTWQVLCRIKLYLNSFKASG